MNNDEWRPPKSLFESAWQLIVPACCWELTEDCEIWDADTHDFDFLPNDIKREALSQGLDRLKGYLEKNGWPADTQHVDHAIWWLSTYIENIDHFISTGEYPREREAHPEKQYERKVAAGRHKKPQP